MCEKVLSIKDFKKSPMNYVGGKLKLMPQILPLLPKKIDVFYDVFCGGMEVSMNVESHKYVINDKLEPLIKIYREFQKTNYHDLIKWIDNRIEEKGLSKDDKDSYLRFRENYNRSKALNEEEALDLFVLICFSFNNQMRFNQQGNYNYSFGLGRSRFNENMRKNLKNLTTFLQQKDKEIILTSSSFEDIEIEKIKKENEGKKIFIYVDPPYLITDSNYNGGWTKEIEITFLNWLKKVDEAGIKFALSNVIKHNGGDNELLQKWIAENGFKQHVLKKDYKNCFYSKKKHDLETIEVLVTNY